MGLALFLSASAVAGVKLPAGTLVELELQQNVTSAYTPTDAPVYFRVKEDVRVDGHVLIRSGTLATGRMQDAQSQQLMAQNGTVAYGVRYVPAVDGQEIRVVANGKVVGRDRSNALATEAILFGALGLLTHGANAWIERGATLHAQVLTDRMIDIDKVEAQATTPSDAWHATAKSHRFDFTTARVVELNLEKSRRLDSVRFEFLADPAMPAQDAVPLHWQLVSIDGARLPQPVDELFNDAKSAVFNSWGLLQYCHEGDNVIGFRAVLPDNSVVDARDTVSVHFSAKR